MNKDEIKDMAIIISGSTELDTMNYYSARYKAKALIDAGYHKIADDEIVVKKSKYEELRNRAEEVFNEMTKRMKAEIAIERKMGKHYVEQAKKETAREILALIGKPNYKGDDWYEGAFFKQEQIREQIADEYGIELEKDNGQRRNI